MLFGIPEGRRSEKGNLRSTEQNNILVSSPRVAFFFIFLYTVTNFWLSLPVQRTFVRTEQYHDGQGRRFGHPTDTQSPACRPPASHCRGL